MLCSTPESVMLDAQNRPYFLWDTDLTISEFKELLHHDDPDVRAYLIGKLMRQAKPDDVFLFVTPRQIYDHWQAVQKHLGKTSAFWRWLFERWEQLGVLDR